MLTSIHPLGERSRNHRWITTVAAYLLGCALGGAVLGVLAGALGAAIESVHPVGAAVSLVTAALVCVAAGITDLHVAVLSGAARVPSLRRQVNDEWLRRYRGWVCGIGFGFQLGLGVVTIVTTATVYAAVVLAVLTGSVGVGLAIGATYGLARGLVILSAAPVHDTETLRRAQRRLDAGSVPATQIAAWTVIVIAGLLTIGLLGGEIPAATLWGVPWPR